MLSAVPCCVLCCSWQCWAELLCAVLNYYVLCAVPCFVLCCAVPCVAAGSVGLNYYIVSRDVPCCVLCCAVCCVAAGSVGLNYYVLCCAELLCAVCCAVLCAVLCAVPCVAAGSVGLNYYGGLLTESKRVELQKEVRGALRFRGPEVSVAAGSGMFGVQGPGSQLQKKASRGMGLRGPPGPSAPPPPPPPPFPHTQLDLEKQAWGSAPGAGLHHAHIAMLCLVG